LFSILGLPIRLRIRRESGKRAANCRCCTLGFLDKETLSDTEIYPILVEDRDDFAGPSAAYEPTKDKNPMNDNQFDIEERKWQNEISLDAFLHHSFNELSIDGS